MTALGEQMAERAAPFLDAPVVGSRPHAETGQSTLLVDGEATTLDRVRSVLASIFVVAGAAPR